MERHPKPGYLFFTPRAPNGKRLSHLRFRHHLRASEDAQPDPRSKEMQGLGGQMAQDGRLKIQPLKGPLSAQMAPYNPRTAAADRDIVRQPGDVAPTVREQMHSDLEWGRKQGYASDRDLTVQQMTERDNLNRDLFSSKPAQPEADAAKPKAGWSFGGKLSFGRGHPKDGPNDASAEFGATYGVEKVKNQLEDEEEKKKRISPNGNSEEQEPNSSR